MTTNGQLLRMKPKHRARYIATLDPAVRMNLARLATFGVARALGDLDEWNGLLCDLLVDHDDGKETRSIGDHENPIPQA